MTYLYLSRNAATPARLHEKTTLISRSWCAPAKKHHSGIRPGPPRHWMAVRRHGVYKTRWPLRTIASALP